MKLSWWTKHTQKQPVCTVNVKSIQQTHCIPTNKMVPNIELPITVPSGASFMENLTAWFYLKWTFYGVPAKTVTILNQQAAKTP